MTMKRTLIALAFIATAASLWAYSTDIPAELKEGANSVVERDETKVTVASPTKATVRHRLLITVMNSNGKDAADLAIDCSSSVKLTKFQGIVYDASGKDIRKISKSDLKRTEYSSINLADDSYYYFYEFSQPTYPYSVAYDYETESNGFISYPSFFPQSATAQSVVKADYSITFPSEVGCRYKCMNVDEATVTASGNSLTASLNNLPAIKSEPYMPKWRQVAKGVIFAPTNFSFGGTTGSMKSWEDLGLWSGSLTKNRDNLTPAQKARIHEIADTCASPLDKIKALYKYMTDNTRYVSIQLGIGGFQPEEAKRVFDLGYGDCKGLSNFMKAMLNEVGIPADYAVISTSYDRLYDNFANAHQLNHAILCVPQAADSLWLECTSFCPVGYVHESIAGHDAILAGESSSKFVHLPKLPADMSRKVADINMTVKPDFSAVVDIAYKGVNNDFEDFYHLTKVAPDKQRDFFKHILLYKEPKVTVKSVDADLSRQPSVTAKASIEISSAGKKTANRLFIMADPVHNGAFRYDFSDRKNPIHVSNRNFDTNLTITIPEEFTVESMPKAFDFQSEVGTISLAAAQNGNVVTLNASVRIRDNDFPADKADLFKEFFTKIRSVTDAQIVLKK